jgi:hypothetical protein
MHKGEVQAATKLVHWGFVRRWAKCAFRRCSTINAYLLTFCQVATTIRKDDSWRSWAKKARLVRRDAARKRPFVNPLAKLFGDGRSLSRVADVSI